jgi:hypothetical protein
MWKTSVDRGEVTDDNLIRRMRFACWITEATDTHSECVIFTAFRLLQQWLRESSLVLRYTSIACLFFLSLSLEHVLKNHFASNIR